MNWDDSLDVIAVHLVGGLVGTLLLGLFADTAVNGEFDGLFFGGGGELLKDQFVAAASVAAFSFVATYLIATVIQRTMGLRVSTDDELLGLDQSQHSESAYTS
jgi:Amt family ammonium transporter